MNHAEVLFSLFDCFAWALNPTVSKLGSGDCLHAEAEATGSEV